MGADLRGLRAGAALAGGKEAGRAVHDLQRSRHVVLLRSLLGISRSASASSYAVADEGGGPRAPAAGARAPGACRSTSAAALVADEFDMSFFQDKALDHGCFSPLSMLWPHEPDWPVPIVPLQVGVLQFPDSVGAALLQARPGAAQRHRKLSGRSEGRDRRAPAACRTRCTANAAASTTRAGTCSSWSCSKTIPMRLTDMTHRRICAARRHGRRRSHHVAGHARRPVGQHQEDCTRPTTCRR